LLCDANHAINERFPVHQDYRGDVVSPETDRMTTMTNIQTNKVLSDADLDAVVGGFLPKAVAALDIRNVEHSNEPNAIKAMQIHNIEVAERSPFGGLFWL
jgi:hypothetical protein